MSTTANLDLQTTDTASLKCGDQEIEMPVVEGSENERAIDISRLRADTGLITLDEGYVNTGSTRSAITFLDGEKGILRYRGYSIEDLAEKADFLEVAYALIFGDLPNKEELEKFHTDIKAKSTIDEDLKKIDKEIKARVKESAEFAQESPELPPEELWTDVLVEVE